MPLRAESRALQSLLSGLEQRADRLLGGGPRRIDDPVAWAEARLGLTLDMWQREVLVSSADRRLLVCPRQSGKSTVVGALAALAMVRQAGTRVVVLSPTMRQSALLSAKVGDTLRDEAISSETATRIVLANGSTLDSLPGDQPKTVRGATADLLLIDEASRVKAELVTAALPMVAATRGTIVMLSTPAGAAGAFFDFWTDEAGEGAEWERTFVTPDLVGHYDAKTLRTMKRRLGERAWRQEFEGAFLEAPGALFTTDDIDSLFDRSPGWDEPIDTTTTRPFTPLF